MSVKRVPLHQPGPNRPWEEEPGVLYRASYLRFPSSGTEHSAPADLAEVAGLDLSQLPSPGELPLWPSTDERKRRGDARHAKEPAV